ncbi:hypothetical protein BC943DRAFT_381829 [Umbelopsis sp. AD052]|nr:hypothetical protein BC943DRAFT_381829 [Umbelopsis sp. AD052]
MRYTSPLATVNLNHPEAAMSKQPMHGKSMFGSKSEHLPRITLCPASFYGCDPITLYEPPTSPMAKVAQYLRSSFRRHPAMDLSASYDSFSKPPSWMKYEDIAPPKPPVKKRRCVSTFAFCLGFLLATASVLIAVLAHKRLVQRDDVVPAESDHMVIRQQVDMLDPAQSALYSMNLFNTMINSGNTTQPLRTQLEENSHVFTTKPKSQSIEIESKAMRHIYNVAVPYNGLPWSLLRVSDLNYLCFQLQNPKKGNAVTVKITRLHPMNTSKNILVERSVFTILAMDAKSLNTSVTITADYCKNATVRR